MSWLEGRNRYDWRHGLPWSDVFGSTMRYTPLLAVSCTLMAPLGCFDPDYANESFGCTRERECPDGYVCLRVEPNIEQFVCRLEQPPMVEITSIRPSCISPSNRALQLSVAVNHFTLDPVNMNTAPRRGNGHYHIYLDRVEEGSQLLMSAETQQNITFDNDDLRGLELGPHEIIVVLVNNNHTFYEPRTEHRITFEYRLACL